MKILLVNPNTIIPPVAPLGLEYIMSYLRKRDIDIRLFDMNLRTDMGEAIYRENPDLIGVTIRNIDDCSFPGNNSIMKNIKTSVEAVKNSCNLPIVAGGSGFSAMPEEIMEYLGIDYGIIGDGEEALYRFIVNFPDHSDVPNLVYRKNGSLVKNEVSFTEIEKETSSREMIDNEFYYEHGAMAGIETKRGCPMGCVYCLDPVAKGNTIRLRDPEAIADEFERLSRKGVRDIHICDSEFNIPYDHAVEVCEVLIRKGINNRVNWFTYCSGDWIDEDLLTIMKHAGCKGINFGIDSLSDIILANLGRAFSASDAVRIGKTCRKISMIFMFDLLLGGPGENEKTLKDTFDRIKDIAPNVVGVTAGLRVYGNTPIYKTVIDSGPISDNPDIIVRPHVENNFLDPVFYLSHDLGNRIFNLIENHTSGMKNYFFNYNNTRTNYNYNDSNEVLINSINSGSRGAFWDIMRKEILFS